MVSEMDLLWHVHVYMLVKSTNFIKQFNKYTITVPLFFSSPEPKAQVSEICLLSIVDIIIVVVIVVVFVFGCRGFKFVQMKGHTFFQGEIITKFWKYIDKFKKSSSPEPVGQFQPNLIQIIFWCRGFKFI